MDHEIRDICSKLRMIEQPIIELLVAAQKQSYSGRTELDVLVIVPMSYVCRSIEKSAAVNLPYYRVSIEKWLW